MFGNKLLYYGGSGGIRRGLIWQNGTEAAPEWIKPQIQYARGTVDGTKLWGSFVFGGIQAIIKVTADEDPVTGTWENDPGPCSVWYNRKRKVIKFDFDWDSLQNTPQNLIGASDFLIAPDWQDVTEWVGTVSHKVLFNPSYSHESIPAYYPLLTIYRSRDGSAWTLDTARFSWHANPWNAAVGYPFTSLGGAAAATADYNKYSTRYYIMGTSIDLWGVSEPFELLQTNNNASLTLSHPYRSALVAVIRGNSDQLSRPVYFRGPWQFTLKNAVFPDFAITNLHNLTN